MANTMCLGVVAVIIFVALGIMVALGFDTLEYQEMGLNYSLLSETIEKDPYTGGRYYLGLGNSFIKFPRMVKSIFFVDDAAGATQAPAVQSRTNDGLNVKLEVSFQYRLKIEKLYDMYMMLGPAYEQTMVRMAIEQLTTSATHHNAHYFFTNRTTISTEMHNMLDKHFQNHAFAEVPFFQLRTVHLPPDFESAIKKTQVKQQEIQTATLEQKTNRVQFETTVLQAEQQVKVMMNEAEAEAASIEAQNKAYCQQYQVTQDLQSASLAKLQKATGWDSSHILDYLKIRAVKDHPGAKTTVKL